jgi:uncharacterized membrane protein
MRASPIPEAYPMGPDRRTRVAAALTTLVTFVILDAVWLSQVGVDLFKSRLPAILRPDPVVGAIVAFYVIYAAGVYVLALRPSLETGSGRTAATLGAWVGLTAYATFDLTNLAVITGWTIPLALIDMTWGVVATALATLAGHTAGRYLSRRRSAAG